MAKEEKKKTCFIIMPITTPPEYIERYSGRDDHFTLVLNEILLPAIIKANYDPIEPITKGSDVIHAHIIKNLESADIVLCDVSIFNPNVFYELGIRTALNKPVCIVGDDLVIKIPFDTSIINICYYSHEMFSYTQRKDVQKISEHLLNTYKNSPDENALWKYFGITNIAEPFNLKEGKGTDIEFIKLQLNKISNLLSQTQTQETTSDIIMGRRSDPLGILNNPARIDLSLKLIDTLDLYKKESSNIIDYEIDERKNIVTVKVRRVFSRAMKLELSNLLNQYGYKVEFQLF